MSNPEVADMARTIARLERELVQVRAENAALQEGAELVRSELDTIASSGGSNPARLAILRDCLLDKDCLLCVSRDLLHHVLPLVQNPAQVVFDQISYRMRQCRRDKYVYQPKYYGYCQDLHTLSELQDGATLAMTSIFAMIRSQDWYSLTGSFYRCVGDAHVFDKMAMSLAITNDAKPFGKAIDHAEKLSEVAAVMSDVEDDINDMLIDPRGSWRKPERLPEELCYGTAWEFCRKYVLPLTDRYFKALMASRAADVVLAKVADPILPPELVDMIKDYCYDRDFVGAAPKLAELTDEEEYMILDRKW